MAKTQIKKDDSVYVISGTFKSEKGKVLAVLKRKNRAVLEMIGLSPEKRTEIGRKTVKKTQKNPQGGLVERSVSVNLSNLKPLKEEKKA